MSSSTTPITTIRPRTTKPRGICKYYTTPRGCFAGSSCKFLHGTPEQLDPQNPLLTPHDESKRCIFYAQGQYFSANLLQILSHLFSGFCRRGDKCWFKHIVNQSQVTPSTAPEEEDLQNDPCSICFEKPATYGLLCTFSLTLSPHPDDYVIAGCSHIFCIAVNWTVQFPCTMLTLYTVHPSVA